MFLIEDRLSDSPLVERVWQARSESAETFLSVAASHFQMVVTRHKGRTFLTLRGPETKATTADGPADGEWLGIDFKLGTFVPTLLPGNLLDRRDVRLPSASTHAFWLNGSAWEYPSFENADVFASRLVRTGVIACDSIVDAVTHQRSETLSLRSTQRHFLRATGITYATWRQIERARYATSLLRQGVSIFDTVYQAGYFDQPHLTRSLTRRLGQTPAEIIRGDRQLSLLYKTETLPESDNPCRRRRIHRYGQNHRD
jgi:AraC-like DNA-binding protein